MYLHYIFTFTVLYHSSCVNKVFAKKRICNGPCEDNLDIKITYNSDSHEDRDTSGRVVIEYDDSNDHIKDLKDQVKRLGKDLRELFETKIKLQDNLDDCLNSNGGPRRKSSKSENLKGSQKNRRIAWKCTVCITQGLCYTTRDGCDYYDDSSEEESREEEIVEKLKESIRKLKKQKRSLEKELRRLTDELEECEGRKRTRRPGRPTKRPTTPPSPTKKFIIRTEKVSWDKADSLCRRENKYLASITSESDQQALGQARKDQGVNSGQLWVGGYRDSQGKFFWKGETLTPFTYTNWHSTEPSRWSDENQNCVESSWKENSYMWFVYECDTEYHYACEYYV